MQRTSVLLPEPLGPMIENVELDGTTRSTPRSTSSAPKRLWTLSSRMTGSGCGMLVHLKVARHRQLSRQVPHGCGNHEHEHEIGERHGGVNGHRQERRADDQAGLIHEI